MAQASDTVALPAPPCEAAVDDAAPLAPVWCAAPLEEPAASRLVRQRHVDPTAEPAWVRRLLIGAALAVVGLFLILPLVVVFIEALGISDRLSDLLDAGVPVFRAFWRALTHPDLAGYWQAVVNHETGKAALLTLLTAAVAVPLNTLFGIAAAYCIAKFEFRGKSVLTTLIDLPFAVSPVVAGLVFVLLFGAHGWFGPLLERLGVKIIYAVPGIILATLFITFPFVARELIPLMEAQGTEEEEAARVLGASGWRTFFRITVPNIKWGLLYGLILCNARAMGEFGAVYVVSSNFSDQMTLPLRVERVYHASVASFAGAFAVASLLVGLALVTLTVKTVVEWRFKRELRASREVEEAE